MITMLHRKYSKKVALASLFFFFVGFAPALATPANDEPNVKVTIRHNGDKENLEYANHAYLYPVFPQLYSGQIPDGQPGAVLNDSVIYFEFKIERPQFVNLGVNSNPIYIEPGDEIEIDYRFLGLNQYKNLLEEWNFRSAKGLRLHRQADLQLKLTSVAFDPKASPETLQAMQQVDYLNDYSEAFVPGAIASNPHFDANEQHLRYIGNYYFQVGLLLQVSGFSRIQHDLDEVFREESLDRFFEILNHISHQHANKSVQYYRTIERLYELRMREKWRGGSYHIDSIRHDTAHLDALSQEYFLFCLLKFSLRDVSSQEGMVAAIKTSLKHEVLQDFSTELTTTGQAGNSGEGYIDHLMRNVVITDYFSNETLLGELFDATEKPLLYLDFCGSWCIPCINEIEQYAQSKRLYDDHADIRAIYIFFENNDQDWKKTIERYKLPVEDCFLVLSTDLQQHFSKKFNWMGTFPHHFIFTQEGKLVNDNAPALVYLQATDYNVNSKSTSPTATGAGSKIVQPPLGHPPRQGQQ